MIRIHAARNGEERVTVRTLVPAALAAAVTTWPREGVVLLILIVLLFAIAAVLTNLRPGRPAPLEERRDAIGPPREDDAVARDTPPHDI